MTAMTAAVERAPAVDTFTDVQIKELRQRVQATGKVIAPVLTSLAVEMFHHGVSNKCVLMALVGGVRAGLQPDVDECLQKWGKKQGDIFTVFTDPDDGEDEAFEELSLIWRDALLEAFMESTLSISHRDDTESHAHE